MKYLLKKYKVKEDNIEEFYKQFFILYGKMEKERE